MLSEFLKIGQYQICYGNQRLADFCIVRGVDMPLRPPITYNELIIDGKPGAWLTGVQIGTRDIIVRLGMLNATRDRVEMLKNWISHVSMIGSKKEQRLDLGGGFYTNAVMVGNSDIIQNGFWSTVDVTFHCSDPHIYGETHEVPLVSGSNKIMILGKAEVEPVFTIKSPSNYIDIQNGETQEFVRVRGIGSSQTLEVDMSKHKCSVNGSYRAADPSVSTFWKLQPGNQTVNIKTGYGTMKYTEAYL